MTVQIRVHGVVCGRVQGVCFRASTQEEAERRGLTGWVRNCADGSVELEAQGPDHAVEALLAWCKQGPTHARVIQVVTREVALVAGDRSFEVTG